MSAAEFETFRDRTISARAAENVQKGMWAEAVSQTLAAHELDNLLPAGPQTPDTLLLAAENTDGEYVGQIWVTLNQSRPGNAWICDLAVNPEHRGHGYAYALAEAAEEQARQHGAYTIGGHVYANNAVMLYMAASAGYLATSVIVRKALRDADR
jgi:GNAT superfamily N-acetyltransferase